MNRFERFDFVDRWFSRSDKKGVPCRAEIVQIGTNRTNRTNRYKSHKSVQIVYGIYDVVCDEKNKIKKSFRSIKRIKGIKRVVLNDSLETHDFIKTPEGVEKKDIKTGKNEPLQLDTSISQFLENSWKFVFFVFFDVDGHASNE